MEKLKEFVKQADRSAVLMFAKQGAIHPMYHAIDGDGKNVIFLATGNDKDISVALARAQLAEMKAKRVLFIDEAWVSSTKTQEEADKVSLFASQYSLENWPGREEVLMYMAEDVNEGMLMAQRVITRDSAGKPSLGDLTFADMGGFSGRMVGLLPRGRMQ